MLSILTRFGTSADESGSIHSRYVGSEKCTQQLLPKYGTAFIFENRHPRIDYNMVILSFGTQKNNRQQS